MATKLFAAVDDEGMPLICTPGNQLDMRLLQSTLAVAILLTPTGTPLYTDKGYDSAANRHTCVSYGYRERIWCRTVVFFGDASYGPSMRGHHAIPKKGILRELCHRGLTILLDECKTSKKCPCGHDELKTTANRLRAHKGDGAVCPFRTRLDAWSCDRDALASLNMVSCALCALGGRTCTGAPLPGHVQTLRVRKTSFFVWTILTKQTVRK